MLVKCDMGVAREVQTMLSMHFARDLGRMSL